MFCVFFSNVFYAKVVNNECKRYWSCCVFPQAGHQFALEISVFVEALFKQFVRKESCLGQSMHSLCDLDTNHALFVGYFLQFVFIDDFLGHVVDFHSDIFWFWSGKMMNYRQLRKHPKYNKAWTTSSANEFGRLASGVGGRVKGTKKIRFIHQDDVPQKRWKDITYGSFQCNVRPEKIEEPNRT